jgi:hypothetical protein
MAGFVTGHGAQSRQHRPRSNPFTRRNDAFVRIADGVGLLATGVNPQAQGLRFLVRDTNTYLPDLGMVRRESA